MNITKLDVKKNRNAATAPLRNILVLDNLICRAIDRASHLPGIVSLSGPSGYGKSTAAAFINAKYQGIYIEIRSTWTGKSFLEAVLHQQGTQPKRTVAQMLDQASEEMAASRRPLILDEFDNAINRNLVELVRDLYEQSNSPIVVIGEEMLPQKLQKWERFHGRIMDWAQAEAADISDAQVLNKHYVPDINIKKDLLQLVVDEARGSVRRIVTNLDMIAQFAKTEGLKDVDREHWGDRKLHSAMPPQPRGRALGGR